MTWQQLGLAAFVLTWGVIGPVLLYDAWLADVGKTVITERCRANPLLAWAILTAIEFGVLGLAIHFMRPVRIE